jgi:hypothetical protein
METESLPSRPQSRMENTSDVQTSSHGTDDVVEVTDISSQEIENLRVSFNEMFTPAPVTAPTPTPAPSPYVEMKQRTLLHQKRLAKKNNIGFLTPGVTPASSYSDPTNKELPPCLRDSSVFDPNKTFDLYMCEAMDYYMNKDRALGVRMTNILTCPLEIYRTLRRKKVNGVNLSHEYILEDLRTYMKIIGPRRAEMDARALAALIVGFSLHKCQSEMGHKWETEQRIEFSNAEEAEKLKQKIQKAAEANTLDRPSLTQ